METIKLSDSTQKPDNCSSIEWLSSSAVAKHKEGKLEEAIAFYWEIIDLDPHQPCSLYINLISLMTKLDLLDKAIEMGDKALAIHPESAEIHRNLGITLSKNRAYEGAIEQYERAIEIEPLQPEWVFINLAKIWLHIHQLDKALAAVKAGLEFYSKSEYLAKIQLKILIDRGDWQQIKTMFEGRDLEQLETNCLMAENVFVLNEYVVYVECSLGTNPNLLDTGAFILDSNLENSSRIDYFTSANNLSFVIVFSKAIAFVNFEIMLVSSSDRAKIEVQIPCPAYGLELIDYLNSQPNLNKHLVKENIIRSVVTNTLESQLASAQELVKKLHSFIKIPVQLCNNINEPFSIHFDLVFPIGSEGLFISGWICDPFSMLEEIDAISSLGFRVSLKDALHYVERADINKAINNTAYKGVKQQHGVVAYVAFSPDIKEKFQPYAQHYDFRFEIQLKGKINRQLIPPTVYYNTHSIMGQIVNTFTAHQANLPLLKECIAPATLAIGKAYSQTDIEIQTFGKSIPKSPLASIVIPINKNFDLMKVQFAMMANDNSVRDCELIYVLSSPAKKHKWIKVIESYSHLYDLPVKLITTDIGNNYGALVNIGITQGKSNLCISMLPDVLPKTENWVNKMADFYSSLSNPGVLTPKLIYEDLSIQHAGMTSDRLYNNWNYKHFYQGLPSTYPAAQQNRSIPAVNGACMMFDRQLYSQTSLPAEYLTPESEAFEFCMQSRKLGYENWYFSEVEMYYLEKQNRFTEFINQYNCELQSKRWH